MTLTNLKSKIQVPFIFSQSSLQDYADCARRFQLRYLEQLRWPAVESEPVQDNEHRQLEGLVFHRLVQQHLLGLPSEKLSILANTPNLERWWNNYQSSEINLDGYAKYMELSLSCSLGDHRLLAKYDLIAIKPGEKALIVDWKTYTKHPRDEWMEARWQTRVYRALLTKAGGQINNNITLEPEQIEMIYWYADFPTRPTRLPYDSNQFKRDWSALQMIVDEVSNEKVFPLTQDEKYCRFCTYRSYCDRGKQAGSITESENELVTGSAFDIDYEQIGEIEY